jgi:hypothetical protein
MRCGPSPVLGHTLCLFLKIWHARARNHTRAERYQKEEVMLNVSVRNAYAACTMKQTRIIDVIASLT